MKQRLVTRVASVRVTIRRFSREMQFHVKLEKRGFRGFPQKSWRAESREIAIAYEVAHQLGQRMQRGKHAHALFCFRGNVVFAKSRKSKIFAKNNRKSKIFAKVWKVARLAAAQPGNEAARLLQKREVDMLSST